MPPWMSRVERLLVPLPKSSFSTRAVWKPRIAASRATAAPVMPPPTISKSNSS
jgi:hypothetical protein